VPAIFRMRVEPKAICPLLHTYLSVNFYRTILSVRRWTKMPRYYFHIDGERPHSDAEGEEHPDDAAAWRSAVRLTRDIETGFEPGHRWSLVVHEGTTPVYLIEIAARRSR
jgi:hypothetical protein